jgi:hypothetical protein
VTQQERFCADSGNSGEAVFGRRQSAGGGLWHSVELAATKECESKSRPAEHPTAPNPVDQILDIFGKKKQRSESATAEGLDISK